MKQIIFTKQGFEDLRKEKEKLQKERPLAVLDLKKAREMGDLSENGYYKSAKAKLGSIDHRLRQLQYLIKSAKIEEGLTANKNVVGIGSTVTLQTDKEEVTYTIVGEYEANPSLGKISHKSPLGSIVLGKKKDEEFLFRESSYTVINLSVIAATSS